MTAYEMRISDWRSDVCSSDLYVSATPGSWEMDQTGGVFAEQVIRPTGLIDPPVEIRPAKAQVDDVVDEIRQTNAKGYRTLLTVLTKDRTRVVKGQSVSVRVALGGSRIITKKKTT